MNSTSHPYFELFNDNLRLYNAIYDEIENAEKYIYIETYKYRKDTFGIKFRDILTKKKLQGVEVKLLIDGWGASVSESFFSELIKCLKSTMELY